MGWNLVVLPALSVWIGVIELDVALIGQCMLARPILVGPVVGLACGELGIGLAMGALIELFSLESSPVGSVLPLNGAVAAGCAVLLAVGARPVAVAAAFPAGLACGVAHSWVEGMIRDWRRTLTAEAAGELDERGEIDWIWLLAKSLAVQAAMTAGFVYAAVFILGPSLFWVWEAAPKFFIDGFETAFGWAPWFAIGTVMHALFRKV